MKLYWLDKPHNSNTTIFIEGSLIKLSLWQNPKIPVRGEPRLIWFWFDFEYKIPIEHSPFASKRPEVEHFDIINKH